MSPYMGEKASRLGHVPTVNNEAVRSALAGWEVTHAAPQDTNTITDLCTPVSELPGQLGAADSVRFSITVDGSDTEVETTRQYPTVKVGYLRVAGSMVDLGEFAKLGMETAIDPRRLRRAHDEYAFDAALPGSGLARPGMSGHDTWRVELDTFMANARFDADSPMTLTDGLLTVHGTGLVPAETLAIRVCPSCGYGRGVPSGQAGEHGLITVSHDGGTCPACQSMIYLADVLRLHEEYNAEGSNFSPVTRAMNMAERLMTVCYVEHFRTASPQVLGTTLFVTDGQLALHGPAAPQSRPFLSYFQAVHASLADQGVTGPLLVGVEKSGSFVEHAEQVKEFIPPGSVMRLPRAYINRVAGRPEANNYGSDEFYGRRFIYRATNGDALVITVLPKPGVTPYSPDPVSEAVESYPHLRLICEVLDSLRTRMYHNAVIPVALAHSSASLPLGVGRSVLTKMAQQTIPGLRPDHQAIHKSQPTFL